MQEVIEKIIGQLESKAFERYGNKGMGGQMVIDYDDAIEIVKQAAAEYNNGWIPCSERIPTEQERWFGHDLTDAEPREFIVMVKGAYEPTTGYYHSKYGWIKDLTREYDDNNTGYANEVVAWKFFPAPYHQNGEQPKRTNFDRCCESMEAMAQIIDIAKIGWAKEQIMEWLQKEECEVPT